MAENKNNNTNQGTDKNSDKTQKPRFNTNWIFAIIAISILAFQFLFSGKNVEKIDTGKLKEMLEKHDVEKIVVINKDFAEIYLTNVAVESGRYPKAAKSGNGMGLNVKKPNFIYNIGDQSRFESFIMDTQKEAGY